MKFFCCLVLIISVVNAQEIVSTEQSCMPKILWEEKGIDIYAEVRHGPDGSLFLDPYFIPFLLNLDGQILLDAGCGAGPWSVAAAQNGAIVYGIDIQEKMIAKAKQAAIDAQLEKNIHFEVGDVGELPYQNDFFDRAISINVGCNLINLEPHFRELHRVLKRDGIAVIAAPASFGIVFTDGQRQNSNRPLRKL